MSEETLSVGDVVRIKSGGKTMTIEEIEGSEVFCVWFVGDQPQRGSFNAATLVKHDPMTGVSLTRG